LSSQTIALCLSLDARCSGLYRFRLVAETEGALVGKQPDYCLMPVLGCEMQHPLLLQVGGGEGAPLSINSWTAGSYPFWDTKCSALCCFRSVTFQVDDGRLFPLEGILKDSSSVTCVHNEVLHSKSLVLGLDAITRSVAETEAPLSKM